MGGYPEYVLTDYVKPRVGAEIYEVNANGYEILRATFTSEEKWVLEDKGYAPAAKSADSVQPTTAKFMTYKGRKFHLRGIVNGMAHLTTFVNYPELDLVQIEKGIWGMAVPADL